jgi:hypothetical protein
MKKSGIVALFLLVLTSGISAAGLYNPYSHLIGITTGGQYFFNSHKADWISGVFFETVLDSGIGMDIHIQTLSVPITNYSTTVGYGVKKYFQFGGGLKFYMGFWKPLFFDIGVDYQDYTDGYLVYNSDTNYMVITSDNNFFSAYAGIGITAQISKDLYTQIGVKFSYDITSANDAMGLRAYFTFGYGI